jgi:hypothetical protein
MIKSEISFPLPVVKLDKDGIPLIQVGGNFFPERM